MHVTRLDLRNLRRFSDVSLRPGRGLNLLTGDNGAGKTSVLEGLHLMAYGRSFRGRVRDGLIRVGSPALEVFVEWDERSVSASSGREVGEMASVISASRPGCATAARTGPAASTADPSAIWVNCVPLWRWSASTRGATP